jgi:hypothetical protein
MVLQRKAFVQAAPVSCAAGVVGNSQAFEVCDFKQKDVKRMILQKKTGANPFTTLVLLKAELTMDTLLAVSTEPDSVFLSTKISNSTQTGGAANPVTTESGDMRNSFYSESEMTFEFAYLDPTMANDLLTTIRDNETSLRCLFVNTDKRIMHGLDATGLIPQWIPIKLATIRERDVSGRSNLEINEVMFSFETEVLTNGMNLTTLNYDIFLK